MKVTPLLILKKVSIYNFNYFNIDKTMEKIEGKPIPPKENDLEQKKNKEREEDKKDNEVKEKKKRIEKKTKDTKPKKQIKRRKELNMI